MALLLHSSDIPDTVQPAAGTNFALSQPPRAGVVPAPLRRVRMSAARAEAELAKALLVELFLAMAGEAEPADTLPASPEPGAA
jgi:hypothetical protein